MGIALKNKRALGFWITNFSSDVLVESGTPSILAGLSMILSPGERYLLPIHELSKVITTTEKSFLINMQTSIISKNEAKFINSLKIKKYRYIHGQFLVEGLKNVREALDAGYKPQLLLCTQSYFNQFIGFDARIVDSEELSKISSFTANEVCLAVFKMPIINEKFINPEEHIFFLDGVSDPGNLGTIVRTLDWFGFLNLVCSENTADIYNPKTIAATMGSFTRCIPLYMSFPSVLEKFNRPVFAMDMNGKPLNKMPLEEPAIFVLGSESHGVSKDIYPHIAETISIPGKGKAESLNVAIATAILCYQLKL